MSAPVFMTRSFGGLRQIQLLLAGKKGSLAAWDFAPISEIPDCAPARQVPDNDAARVVFLLFSNCTGQTSNRIHTQQKCAARVRRNSSRRLGMRALEMRGVKQFGFFGVARSTAPTTSALSSEWRFAPAPCALVSAGKFHDAQPIF